MWRSRCREVAVEVYWWVEVEGLRLPECLGGPSIATLATKCVRNGPFSDPWTTMSHYHAHDRDDGTTLTVLQAEQPHMHEHGRGGGSTGFVARKVTEPHGLTLF